jgi:hypothetical protein
MRKMHHKLEGCESFLGLGYPNIYSEVTPSNHRIMQKFMEKN